MSTQNSNVGLREELMLLTQPELLRRIFLANAERLKRLQEYQDRCSNLFETSHHYTTCMGALEAANSHLSLLMSYCNHTSETGRTKITRRRRGHSVDPWAGCEICGKNWTWEEWQDWIKKGGVDVRDKWGDRPPG